MSKSPPPPRKKPNFIQIILSVLGAFIGVQSQQTHERDFEHGHPWWIYALIGIGIAAFFISSLVFLVNFILK
jgi:hypothetical protein